MSPMVVSEHLQGKALLSLYLVLSLSSSSLSLDRQLCADTRVYVGRARSTVEVHGRDGEASYEQLPSVFIDPCLYHRCTSY